MCTWDKWCEIFARALGARERERWGWGHLAVRYLHEMGMGPPGREIFARVLGARERERDGDKATAARAQRVDGRVREGHVCVWSPHTRDSVTACVTCVHCTSKGGCEYLTDGSGLCPSLTPVFLWTRILCPITTNPTIFLSIDINNKGLEFRRQ